MVVLKGGDVCHGEERKHEVSPLKRDHIRIKKPGLGSNAGSNSLRQKHDQSLLDMLLWLKEVATDPCNPRLSPGAVRQSRGQILKLRKVLLPSNAEFPSKKRKLQQFLCGKSSDISELTSEKSYQQSFTGLSKGQSSSASSRACLHNHADSIRSLDQTILHNPRSSFRFLNFGDNFQGNQVSTDPSFQDDALDWTNPPNDDFPLSIDSDESVNGSNPSSPTKTILRDSLLLIFDDSVNSVNPSSTEKPKQLNLQTSRKSIRLLNFIGDYLPRMAIPVGPRFQADVPDWTDPCNNENPYDCDSDYSKWLGTQIWPIEGGRTRTIERVIGKGKPDSCSCVSPRSVECIKHHIIKERSRLQSDLGPAFFSWKFDEMGEEVSKLWSLKEERSFKSLVKMNPISTGKSFWKPALKLFPSKCKESIVSYYFNVFVPRRMSMQTRSTSEIVNSDDDEVDESMGSRKRCRAESVSFGRSKDVKTRYLIQPR
ncbi:hypothetical protein HHK36_027208 [Tetracentron sinense]|uniref:ELM2 domain-containing protein n=1 Tax=Tetracentron sinense TaxID=13715 RepID=A0A835D2U0_TETSI|nr:hypothetical protein HHK36_027208 [Tetracentron sinense]